MAGVIAVASRLGRGVIPGILAQTMNTYPTVIKLQPSCQLVSSTRANCGSHQGNYSSTQPEQLHALGQANRSLLVPKQAMIQPVRTRVICSRSTGDYENNDDVTDRFFRLANGMWIRTCAGRAKKLWKKSPRRQHRLQEHIFCNQRQCWLLDKLTIRHYKERKHYPNDPYEPYHRLDSLPDYKFKNPKYLP